MRVSGTGASGPSYVSMPDTYALMVGSGWDGVDGGEPGVEVTTRFGAPSGPVYRQEFGGHEVLALARHGEGHALPPHRINYRANILALKDLGASAIIALNTVGVITTVAAPGEIALPGQLIDYTWGREQTLFDGHRGEVEHIDFTEPFTPCLRAALAAAAEKAGARCFAGGVYAATQGPRLETAAEVARLGRDGADFVGMTAMPEASLAREAGLDYACIALVVNHAAGRSDEPIHEAVSAHTQSARDATRSVLAAFFGAL
jgi:5'-methylthioinosine phosphorylase